MFEKEAEEEINKEHWTYSIFKDLAQEYWQKGAEFGYNKGYHDAEEHYMNVIDSQHKLVEESKANEWHYVKDELPKDNEYVLIYTDLNNCYVAEKVENHFMSKGCGFIPMSTVIAWKEIVLPELPKPPKGDDA